MADEHTKKPGPQRQDEVILRRRRPQLSTPAAEVRPLELKPEQSATLKRVQESIPVEAWSELAITITIARSSGLPKLPPGYYFKGGAARELLRRTLFPNSPRINVRDYDIVRFIDTDDEEDHRLALQLMADDYEFGRGVEVVESRERYFATRDITINEVLFRERSIECSYAAADDLLSGILRPTQYVHDAEGTLQSRTAMKLVRLLAEALVQNINLKILDLPHGTKILPFDAALHLERALAVNEAVATEYVLQAWQRGLLLPDYQSPPLLIEAVRHLAQRIPRGITFFRSLPPELIKHLN